MWWHKHQANIMSWYCIRNNKETQFRQHFRTSHRTTESLTIRLQCNLGTTYWVGSKSFRFGLREWGVFPSIPCLLTVTNRETERAAGFGSWSWLKARTLALHYRFLYLYPLPLAGRCTSLHLCALQITIHHTGTLTQVQHAHTLCAP